MHRTPLLLILACLILPACGGGGDPRPAAPIPEDGIVLSRTFELEAEYATLWGGTVVVHHPGRHDPDDILIVTPVDKGRGHVDVPLQVWWADTLNRWVIQRVDGNPITYGQAFNVSVFGRDEDAFVFQVPGPAAWTTPLPNPSRPPACRPIGFLVTQNLTPRAFGLTSLNRAVTRYPISIYMQEFTQSLPNGSLTVDSTVPGAALMVGSTFNLVRMSDCVLGTTRLVRRNPGNPRLYLGDLGRGRPHDARLQVMNSLTFSLPSNRPLRTDTIPVLRYDTARGEWEIVTAAGTPPPEDVRYFVFEDALATRIIP